MSSFALPAIFADGTLTIAGKPAIVIAVSEVSHCWSWLSHFPERRAAIEVEGLGGRINAFAAFAFELSQHPEARIDLDAELVRFIQMHVALTRAFWNAESRCASWFIAGPAKFPTERNRKRMAAADARRDAASRHSEKARASIIRRGFPNGAPPPYGTGAIRSDRPDAIEKLKQRIQEREAQQQRMKDTNAAHAAFRRAPDAKRTAELMAKLRPIDEQVARNYAPEERWQSDRPYPAYGLQNNLAEIKRLRTRLALIEAEAGRETLTIETNAGFTIIENQEEARLQLIFPGKPDEETRALLKSNGFKWAPSQGAWQRLLNNNARSAARQIRARLETEARP